MNILLMRRENDYKSGLSNLGIPSHTITDITQAMKQGKLPDYLVDVVIQRQDELIIHPDNYPWHPHVSDEVSEGLDNQGIDTRKVWESASEYAGQKYGKKMPANCAIDMGTSEALTNLFEMYALLEHHDLDELKGKKVRF